MQRRDFILQTVGVAAASLLVGACSTTASTTTTNTDKNSDPQRRRRELDNRVSDTLERLYREVPGAREVAAKANGILVFPSVINAGLVVGGQYGEGALRVRGASSGYYNIASISVGLQVGAQSKAIIFLFLTPDSLEKFRASNGWSVGADASVAVIKVGANGMIDATTARGPVAAFVMTNTGLMADLSLEGTKITRLQM
ncbi:BPSL1445 family SYLF domain-containing lipoprotein [Noviherbaspirillum pedocola]|uniref:Twin-arginine translocation pathway signal n=1 Tax=Noviherbaspirillum pedocola TaxID=2801341 RepID=A0A934ST85_9BURK|nr:YSC84-related protein [Noviherbaspirillum pedocola]MBK4735079.1 twin-arginine translocation pathway signal [Noviherbaspirillum pedocola]